MNGYIIAILALIGVIIVGFGVAAFMLNAKDKEIRKAEEKARARQTEDIKKKESFETGNPSNDVSTSVNVLSELARKQKK